MTARLTTLLCAALALAGVGIVATPQTALAQQQDAKTVNPKMGPPLQAALTAAKNKQYDVALAKIKEAEAEKKTPYEQFKINETLAFIYAGQKRYADLAAIYEKMVDSQFVDKSRINAQIVAQTYSHAQQHAKVIEYSKRWLQDNPNDAAALHMLGQAYYLTRDSKSCKDTMSAAISNAEKSGSRTPENWLALLRSCAAALGDNATANQVLDKLVRSYGKPEYWQTYIRNNSNNATDIAAFHWARLMNEVGVLKEADDYSNYAQQAMLVYGSPAEALRVVEDGFKKKILGADAKSKARHEILLTKTKEAAQTDKAQWSQMAAAADQDATGEKSAAMGMAYFGAQQYDQAINYLDKAVKKGSLKETAHVRLTLGEAQLAKNQRDAARANFKAAESDAALGKVAAAWMIRSYN